MTTQPKTWTFPDLLQARRQYATGVLLDAVKMTGHRGRCIHGTRYWTEAQAKAILAFADGSVIGRQFS